MNIKDLLQQYEDGTFGYYLIDGDEHGNYKTESKIIYMQHIIEDREEFITKNGITFRPNQYGSNLKLDKQINNEGYRGRKEVAYQGYGLDKLVNDEDFDIRLAIIRQGYGLDKLINDERWYVRQEVAKQGYGLDKLINDDWRVRAAVARQGYGLDKLVNDKDPTVRSVVAEQGYGLDKLVNDEHRWVRKEVARQGYGLEKLINDPSEEVREEVAKYLNEKADDDFIINLGNKLLDMGYKLSTDEVEDIFEDKNCNKVIEFYTYKEVNGLIYQVLARLLLKNIRIKEIYDPNYKKIMKIYLRQIGKLKDD